jgi:hypothetical protein
MSDDEEFDYDPRDDYDDVHRGEEWVRLADGIWLILWTLPSEEAVVLWAIRSPGGSVQIHGL